MIRCHRYYCASAAVFIVLCLSLAITMPKTPKLKEADARKSDRIATAFPGLPINDSLEPKPVRVIPISTETSLNQPTTSAVLTRIATAMPILVVPEERSHSVSTAAEAAVSDRVPAEPVDPPRYRRRYTDVCAAHGTRKREINHGSFWRCAGLARR